MKLALGTVQFGLDYGISNSQGQVCPEEISRILTLAKENNINVLDTAASYGESEAILGKNKLSRHFNFISKIPVLNHNDISIAQHIETSLTLLQVSQLDAVLFHSVDDIISSPYSSERFNALSKQKSLGKVNKIGVSVYTPAQLKYCVEHYKIDIVQLPLSCLDQRFIQTNWLNKLANAGIEVHCRSLFLQGLLLMPLSQLNRYFSPFYQSLKNFTGTAQKFNISPLALALAIGCQQQAINKMVLGCCNVHQLSEIINAYHIACDFKEDLSFLACNDENLLIPSNWSLDNL